MSDTVRIKDTRSSLLHVRVKPALRERIEDEAREQGVVPSVVIRKILAAHYEKPETPTTPTTRTPVRMQRGR